MSFAITNLIDEACLLAGQQGAENDPRTELLVPRIINFVTHRLANDPNRRGLVTNTYTQALVNGIGTLNVNILVEYIRYAAVEDPADATMAKKMRWAREWAEFVRPLDLTLGYFIVNPLGTTFNMTRPGTAYTPGSGMTGNISITTVAVPVYTGGSVTCSQELDNYILLALTAALKGEWPPIVDPTNKAMLQ